jgi:hypothetical protein
MKELDNEDQQKPTEGEQKEETTIEQREAETSPSRKPVNKSLITLAGEESQGSGTSTPGTSSETSSIAPEDEVTLRDSEELDAKKQKDKKEGKTPRKLIEDEQRAKGRIAWPVWKTYFGVSTALSDVCCVD